MLYKVWIRIIEETTSLISGHFFLIDISVFALVLNGLGRYINLMDEGNKLTPKLIAQLMMDGCERKARQAEKDNDFGAAKVYWQLSQINAKRLARMSKPTKPKGFTKKLELGLSI